MVWARFGDIDKTRHNQVREVKVWVPKLDNLDLNMNSAVYELV